VTSDPLNVAAIARRLDAGESVEIYAEPKHGLQVAGMGAAMAGLVSYQYLPRALDDVFMAVGLGVVMVPMIAAFTWLIGIGYRRWKTPPRLLALHPEGIQPFQRSRVIPWSDILAVEPRAGGRAIEIELKGSAELEPLRGERWAYMLRKRPHSVTIPAHLGFESGALLTLLEARVQREMLEGESPNALPESS